MLEEEISCIDDLTDEQIQEAFNLLQAKRSFAFQLGGIWLRSFKNSS